MFRSEWLASSCVLTILLDSIRERAKIHFQPIAYQCFLRTYNEYVDAVVMEAALREKEILSVEDCRILRRAIGAPRPCFALIEACLDIGLPDEVVDHPTLRRMSDAMCDMLLWVNVSHKSDITYHVAFQPR